MELTKRHLKTWPRLGSRATFGTVLFEIAKENPNLMVLCSDTSTSAGLDRFRRSYPENYVEVGIAEQNLMGIATGLASEGFDVVTATFSPFQTLRCCEQIKVNLGYMQHKVVLAGLASGIVLGKLGYTHCSIEDVAVMRAIPNLTVVSPADCAATGKAVASALEHHHSVYIRLTGGAPAAAVYTEDFDFNIGQAAWLRRGGDVTLIAAGTMVAVAIAASDRLAEAGVEAAVIDMHTIKPVDAEAVTEACHSSRLLVTIEEHSVIGGLGSAVAEVKSGLDGAPAQLILGLPDSYADSGGYQEMLGRAGLTADGISRKVLDRLG